MAAHASSSPAGRSLTRLRKPDKPNTFPSTLQLQLQLLSPPWTLSPHHHSSMIIISSSPSPPPPTLEDDKPIFLQLTYEASDPPWNQFKTAPKSSPEEEEFIILELLASPSTQELALQMYSKARKESDFRPRKPATVKAVLACLVKSRRWRQLLDLILDDVTLMDSATCAWLVTACVRARKFRLVDVLLQEAVHAAGDVTSRALQAAIEGYNKLHMYSSSASAYELMINKSASAVVLDPSGYTSIMEAYMKLGKSGKVLELFKEIESRIEDTSNPTRVYEVLIEALGRSGEAFSAIGYFREMSSKGIAANASIYSSMIGSLADAGQVEAAEELVEQGRRSQMLRDPAMFLKLVLMYVKLGLIERTLGVVEATREANIRVSDCIFCAIVNGFAKQRGLRYAVEVYEDLFDKGIEPGQVTLASILNVYFRLGMYAKAELVFETMDKRGFDRCVVAYSTMIVMYGKTGKPREAMKLVAKMKAKGCEPNVWIYNSLIDLHGRAMNVRQVEKVWKEMKRRKVVPDRVSYTSLISAYSKAREYDKCVDTYREFRLNGGVADRAMAGMMVGVLSKIERIDELVGLLQDMRAQGTKMDERLCRSAMNALRDAGLRVHMSWLEDQSFDPVAISSSTPATLPAGKAINYR